MIKKLLFQSIVLCFHVLIFAQNSESRITSVVDSSDANNMVLKQSFTVNAPIDSVWNSFTTKKGWESWATSIAEIDFKINGTIKTNYNTAGKIGDDSTIVLHIINFIPKRMLTLQAELTKNFPDFMKTDEKDLFNMILFKVVSPSETRVTSYGIGYKNNKKYMDMMKFFIQGNVQSYLNLITYLETGKPSVKY